MDIHLGAAAKTSRNRKVTGIGAGMLVRTVFILGFEYFGQKHRVEIGPLLTAAMDHGEGVVVKGTKI